MLEKLIGGLASGGPMAAIAGLLIWTLGQKIDRLHAALLELAKAHSCQYDEAKHGPRG